MAQANDSILVTPGSGATHAAELINSKKYQVWVEADAFGQIVLGQGMYIGSQSGAIFPTGPHKLCALWNGAGSGVTLEVFQYNVTMDDAIGDTWDTKNFPRIHRITAAPSAGTTRTPVKTKTTLSTLPAQVLFYGEGVTATAVGDPLSLATLFNGGTSQMSMIGAFGKLAIRHDIPDLETIVLAAGEGIVVDGGDNNNIAASGSQALYFVSR